jgi:hypothetical protein
MNRAFYSDRIIWEAKLHSTDAGDVPILQFKRGAAQEMYSPGRASTSEDLTDSD